MPFFRMPEPPEEIEKEASELLNKYYESIPDDADVDEDEKWVWIYNNATQKFKAYLDEQRKSKQEADEVGEMI